MAALPVPTPSRVARSARSTRAGAPRDEDDLRVYFSFNVAQGVPQPFTPAGVQAFRLIASGITAALGTGPADPAAGPALLQEAAGRLFLDITGALRSPLGRRVLLTLLDRAEARSAVLLRGMLDDPRLAPHPARRPARRALAWARRAPGGARILSRVVRAVVDPEKARAEVWGMRQALLAAGAIAPDAGAPARVEATSRAAARGPRPGRGDQSRSSAASDRGRGAEQRPTGEGVQLASDFERGGDQRVTREGVDTGALARVEHAQRLLLTWPGRIVPRVLPLLF
ncbi:MAG TPA: hypothetical protein VHQ00_02685, partial [Chloroflexota bacterium]|nr:hypothetical protein [Chloroflexota bacterium]